MNKLLLVVMALMMTTSFEAVAAKAKTLKVNEKIEINASADKVWENLGDFGAIEKWHPAFASTEIVGGTNNKVGAQRVLTLKDGGKINETLTAYSASKKTMTYKITESVVPVSHYLATIDVVAKGANKSLVVWHATFKRKDLADAPAAGQDDETAVKTITTVFQAGLENVKKISE
ncbi:MAG TPA: SRPBCC family protein [Methylophilaceae bacterium]|jgi:mxaD protein